MSTALIIVDYQKDFIEGSLAVPEAKSILNKILATAKLVDFVAFTGDYHPEDHISFSDKPKFIDKSWPSHCVVGESGSDINEDLLTEFPDAPIFLKGEDKDVEEYSGFSGKNYEHVSLNEWLQKHGVDLVFICGLALDYCVAATANDSLANGFPTVIVLDATRPVSYETGMKALHEFLYHGGQVGISDDTIEASEEPQHA